MPSTHLSLHYHIVFSTKDRCRFIDDSWRDRLHAMLGGAVRALEGIPQAIGGVEDHVHLLFGLRATHCLADVVRDVKRTSSHWVHSEIKLATFSWQDGYGAFTVSAPLLETARKYIKNQADHHRKRSFQEEYRDLLVRSGVQFDERFLW